ncbi:MAG: UDP-4-amino-4,6-dideoxy-N-acetyl-beta-L-altrosamine transaminase [Desulfobacterales bacterium]|nr:UDP-4-amino-4,6-dideoxy-N-acetyl-beta-L-altrosamine transaminase [Desulfobacterales bacterium]
MIPYGRQQIDEDDIRAVIEVLRSDWLTTGPKVAEFETEFARQVGTSEAVAVSNGTAALHTAMHALGIGPEDEVIVPTMTFAATANCVVFQGATPVFVDVDPDKLLIDPDRVEEKITSRTKAVIAMDYAGHPADYGALKTITEDRGIALVADACHALGALYKTRAVGSLATLTTFSFHPVKHITTAEGGMVTTSEPMLALRMRNFRNHGITSDHYQREAQGSWFYEMVELGYNYRLTDLQCALGISQLRKLRAWIDRRQSIAQQYRQFFSRLPAVKPLSVAEFVENAYHLFVVRIDFSKLSFDRATLFTELRGRGVGVNVHYIPVHLHPFYRNNFGTGPGLCPVAEAAYEEILSLPMHAGMTDEDVETVCLAFRDLIEN